MANTLQPVLSRRAFVAGGGAMAASLATSPSLARQATESSAPRPKVAAVFTELRFRSHAYNILENFLAPYLFNGRLTDPGVDVVSFYADQFPSGDMARDVSQQFQVPLFKSIDQALCIGGRELAVDAVLLIGEHGDYPLNERGQRMYPRKQFFDQIAAVMHRTRRYVPIFNDKHLSYRWDWAKAMYDVAREHGIPLMAGSSVPLAERRPPLDLPAGAEIEEAVSIHGGGLESYDFHGLEVLQSMVEARKGGETGISQIELLSGDALRAAAAAGRWSRDLFDAAMEAERRLGAPRQPRPDMGQAAGLPGNKNGRPEAYATVSHALLVTYKDGLKGTVLQVGSSSDRWNFACRLRGNPQPQATAFFNSPWGNRGLFKALSHAIQYLFTTRKQPYPIERTLLTSGALDAAMHSQEQQGRPIATPQLEFAYQPVDFRAFRESGASWKIITKQTPQPQGFEPGDAARVKR
jgi:hypothetical protein